jgi:hypothetical protein
MDKKTEDMRTILISTVCCMALAGLFAACDKENEVVPIDKSNTTQKHYKMPDPVLLSDEEQAEVQAIRNEYHRNVPQ